MYKMFMFTYSATIHFRDVPLVPMAKHVLNVRQDISLVYITLSYRCIIVHIALHLLGDVKHAPTDNIASNVH